MNNSSSCPPTYSINHYHSKETGTRKDLLKNGRDQLLQIRELFVPGKEITFENVTDYLFIFRTVKDQTVPNIYITNIVGGAFIRSSGVEIIILPRYEFKENDLLAAINLIKNKIKINK